MKKISISFTGSIMSPLREEMWKPNDADFAERIGAHFARAIGCEGAIATEPNWTPGCADHRATAKPGELGFSMLLPQQVVDHLTVLSRESFGKPADAPVNDDAIVQIVRCNLAHYGAVKNICSTGQSLQVKLG